MIPTGATSSCEATFWSIAVIVAPVSISANPVRGEGAILPARSSDAASAGCTEIATFRTAPVRTSASALGCPLASSRMELWMGTDQADGQGRKARWLVFVLGRDPPDQQRCVPEAGDARSVCVLVRIEGTDQFAALDQGKLAPV